MDPDPKSDFEDESAEPLDIDEARKNLGLTTDEDGKIKEIETEKDVIGLKMIEMDDSESSLFGLLLCASTNYYDSSSK